MCMIIILAGIDLQLTNSCRFPSIAGKLRMKITENNFKCLDDRDCVPSFSIFSFSFYRRRACEKVACY